MKIAYWLDYQKEIEIDLSHEDVSILYCEAYSDNPKAIQEAMLSNLNSFASYLKGIPDEGINELSEPLKKTISTFFSEQAKRYAPKEEK